jgi:gluconokinase
VILIVAGVAGSGKTTVGALLAGRLRWRFADADTFHSEANVAKMRAGIPLTDEDRQPWLRAVTGWIDDRIAEDQSGVITCSALKRAYRAELLDGRPAASMVFLLVSREALDRRLTTRPGHFFPEGDAPQTAAKVIATLWPYGESDQDGSPVPGVL